MTEIATIDETTTDLIRGQVGFNSTQRAMLAQLGLSDAPEGDLILFSHVCQKSGLDPFRREIFMIGRNTQVTRYEKVDPDDPESNQRKVTRWETVYTIQTGIQGFRKRARELADEKGDRLGFDGPYWCGEDGNWKEIWPDTDKPVAAKYIVFRNGEPVPAVTHYAEYVQTTKVDGVAQPNSMWSKMPRNQLAKCAEALALQRAYPDELSGIVLEDAAQVIDSDGQIINETQRPPARARGAAALRDRAKAEAKPDPDVVNADVVDPPHEDPASQPRPMSDATRRKWLNRMFQLLGEARCTEKQSQLAAIAKLADAPDIEHRDALDDGKLKTVVNQLNQWEKSGQLVDKVADILDQAAIDEAQAAEQDAQQTIDGAEGGGQ
ncbi:RecT family protein [Mycobacterium marinum]|uniref:recombinase RecT n=1 Tax=Mycobacterium marinum TaxID=1781 RepID=UPI000E28AADE|nr:recombinase RecT [Mycobacterium marinum]AXN43429.1 RecT family protein [Mycobacterium marinum]RFZ11519.1 RecT family protein [Mycobacterium marinum]